MNDLENLRKMIEKFDEIQNDLEDINNQLEKNFSQYNKISNASNDATEKITEILNSINSLYINAEETSKDAVNKAQDLTNVLSERYSNDYEQIKRNFDELISTINNSITSLNSNIQNSIKKSTQNIDITPIKSELDKRIKEISESIIKINKIDDDIEKKYNDHAQNITKRFEKLDAFTNKKVHEIAKEVKEINEVKDSLVETRQELINQTKKYKRQIKNAMALPRLFIGTFVIALMIGLVGGSLWVEKLTKKPIVQTTRIYNLPELRKKMTKDGWVHYSDIEAIAKKYEPKPVLIITKIPIFAWILAIIGLLFLLPNSSKKDE